MYGKLQKRSSKKINPYKGRTTTAMEAGFGRVGPGATQMVTRPGINLQRLAADWQVVCNGHLESTSILHAFPSQQSCHRKLRKSDRN